MARIRPAGEDRNGTGERGSARGEQVEPPQFESGLDYAAFVETDDAGSQAEPITDEVPVAADTGADTQAIPGRTLRRADQDEAGPSDPGTQPTQALDRGALDRLAAADAASAGGTHFGADSGAGAHPDAGSGTGPDADGHSSRAAASGAGSHPGTGRPDTGHPAAGVRKDRADVVTATATPEPTGAWPTAAGAAPVPAGQDAYGSAHGSTAADAPGVLREQRDAQARAAARDEALQGSPTGPRVMQALLAIFFPLVVLIAAVRLVASPVFLWIEYHRPGFPDDPYGFTTGDRLTYGSAGMDYLFNAAPPRYLGDIQHQGAPLFTDAEVAHMADVKVVMLITMAVGLVLALACIAFLVALSRRAKGGIRRALFAGSVWMLVALIVLGVLAALSWQQFFATFHSLFFAEGTWTFLATDSLIRLYPGQFWIDAGLAVGLLVLATLVITLVCTWPTRRRRYDSRLAQEDLIRRRNAWLDTAS